ncbi:hypothetical protein F2Q70_00032947 [Brassica cretica]|uniref:Uncharacterized protein n=1 Tax=Brassica cretica TaxID=69181 RepID=A0A8S9FH35_BRACR|nr:hypothetical protein F2Q70_00032947 [Brassica cretica]
MLLLVGTPPRLTRSISRRGEELLKSQRSSFSSVSAFSTPSSLSPVRTRLSDVSGPAFLSVTKSPPSLPSKPEPPDLVPGEQLEHLLEALSPPDLPLEALSPPEPPDPPDVPVVGNMILCWCVDWSSKCSFPSMIVIVVVAATLFGILNSLVVCLCVSPWSWCAPLLQYAVLLLLYAVLPLWYSSHYMFSCGSLME